MRLKTATACDAQPLRAVHHGAGRFGDPRVADRPVDDLRVGVLSFHSRTRSGDRGRADIERPLQQLCAAGGAALHPCRRFDEQWQSHRSTSQVLPGPRRSISRRPRSRQRSGQHHLCRDVRLGDRGCRWRRSHHHRHDDARREISNRICGRHHGLGSNHWTYHSAFHSDGGLRAGVRRFDRISVSWRRHARLAARGSLHGHEHPDCQAQELSCRGTGAPA